MAKILVIDADWQSIELIRAFARILGHTVVSSSTGTAIHKLVETEQPALILLDLRLPRGHDGWTITQSLKATPALQHIPIVAVSVVLQADDQERAYRVGCSDFLAKPFGMDKLKEIIRHYIPA